MRSFKGLHAMIFHLPSIVMSSQACTAMCCNFTAGPAVAMPLMCCGVGRAVVN